jgi:hypothetical protein
MKNIIFSILALVAVADTAVARSIQRYQTIYTCEAKIERPGPIQGYNLEIVQDYATNTKLARMYPICPACMVEPTEVEITGETLAGTNLIYSGRWFKMTVYLETLIPTNNHFAKVVTPYLNKGQPLVMSCSENIYR